jgi:uncharacterized protein with HEPN domain
LTISSPIALLSEFTNGKALADYEREPMLRAAVERKFEIIGETLAQLAKSDGEIVGGITEYQRIIAFRNILIHGYADVVDRLVWDVIEKKLPILSQEVEILLRSQ